MTAPVDVTALHARIAALEAELSQLNQVQSALMHGISHDLRGPMRALDGFSQQLANELEGNVAASERVAKIRAAVLRVTGLTASLLEYSRAARATLRHDEVDLAFIIDWVLMDLRAHYPQLAIEAEVQPGVRVRGDEHWLRILFQELFDNSCQFAGPGKPVVLRIQAKPEASGLYLTVSDTGIGMNLRDPSQPFEPFMRLHGSREGAGDGLGLAIAQAIVHRHGGRIWMTSAPNQGSTVHIHLPQATSQDPG